MKGGHAPGKKIGTFDAVDVNTAIDYLAALVKKNNLPPKILVVHRFTQGMLTNYKAIKNVPEVQVVIDMDGWGNKTLKRSTYLRYVYKEPVEYTGFKLFYKNDTKTGADQLYSPQELLKFIPKPIYIQYQ
jgi:lipoprotein-anchoring transpeptidase ErfK/SrfK